MNSSLPPLRRPVRRLPEALVHKIAAGEVVERPASVVKELVENSLDAGARRVAIVVEAGGKNFIQVEDDGAGMGPEDARLAVEAHATSKLASLEELESVGTLGFRGEALATIAAVSRFELRTCPAEGEGLQLWIADGTLLDEAPWRGAPGTRILVRNLFFSTPARRKFLSSHRAELRQILQVLRRIALAHPATGFKLVADGQTLADWPAGAEADRLEQVFGPELAGLLLPVDHQAAGLRVRGHAGQVNTFRRSQGDQYLFINGRPIVSRVLAHAVYSAYGHTLQRDQLPFFLLFLETDPKRVDVNVHPAKREVRFEDERQVHGVVHEAVARALAGAPVAQLGPDDPGPRERDRLPLGPAEFGPGAAQVFALGGGAPLPAAESGPAFAMGQAPLFPGERRAPGEALAWSGVREYLDSAALARERFGLETGDDSARQEEDERRRDGEPGLFQLHRTYILAQVPQGLIIVDQHVAHERILYERGLASLREQRGSSQRLLFPVPLKLDDEDRLVFEELLEPFLQMGFSMEMQGGDVLLTGMPAELRSVHPEGLIQDVLDQFRLEASLLPEPGQALAASVACKAAVKAGQPLSQVEMRSLLDELFACEQPYTCPHGRPVVVTLGLSELNRRFART
ncbi:MAG: DNA mismatch repair endonuclease MutL [Candidatus Delongbacteria bacterium]